ncbi:MAG: hemolysin [Chloroflexi bacterium]|nr:hemolysin [Chloroflexota bacterium]
MAPPAPRVRLDELLVRRGHAPSREKARALVLAGDVAVQGSPGAKPGQLVRDDVPVEVRQMAPYVSRGGIKLAHGLDRFGVDPNGRVCADVGASTGGFTDCLLQRGAERVYAIDVGYGQLDWRLRIDPRVVLMERVNARYLETLPQAPGLVTVDASFISLEILWPALVRIASAEADFVALVKPQFEAGRDRVGKGGVVRDPTVHRDVLLRLASWLDASSNQLLDVTASPIRGPAGNVEFLAWIRRRSEVAELSCRSVDDLIQRALAEQDV